MALKELYGGRYLRLVERDGWEWVERSNASGVVVIAAITAEEALLLVEQFRVPVNAPVIELPAGLAGDIAGEEDEALAIAARRELHEETGYEAERMEPFFEGPTSAGLTTETVSFFHAHGLRKTGPGGGDESEDITIHEVPLSDLAGWLERRQSEGALVDPKIFAALYFLNR